MYMSIQCIIYMTTQSIAHVNVNIGSLQGSHTPFYIPNISVDKWLNIKLCVGSKQNVRVTPSTDNQR